MSQPTIALSRPVISEDEKQNVMKVLESGILAQGQWVADFEKAYAAEMGVTHAVAVSSGTAALHVALLAHGVGPGDEVITSSFSFIASANSILYCGAKPVFADIDPVSFNLDPKSVEAKITPRTKAILPVHLFGNPADMEAFQAICKKHKLALVEDACQAHGAMFDNKKVGSFGSGCFSFYPTKNMTSGEGGMITTNDADVANRAKLIRSHGMPERYKHTMLGFNLRMSNLHAAIGVGQLQKLNGRNDQRRKNGFALNQKLAGVKGIVMPTEQPRGHHVFHQYTIRVTGGHRDAAREQLTQMGIGTDVYYPRPIHQQPYYVELGFKDVLPLTEAAAKEVISLPVRPDLTAEELQRVADAVKNLKLG